MTDAVLGIVAGSGIELRDIFDTVLDEFCFNDVPGLAMTSVAGHDNKFIFGTCGPHKVMLQCGRVHVYEGHGPLEASQTVAALQSFGTQTIIFSNAVGGLLPEMAAGDLVTVEQVRLWPFRQWENMPDSIDTDFCVTGCEHRGTYMWMHGPCYETRAEIGALREIGVSAVGMSLAPELWRCRQLGIKAAAMCCVTNNCCSPQSLTHEHVLKTARTASRKMVSVLREFISEFDPD